MALTLGISNVAAGLSPEEKLQRIHAARASAGKSSQNRSGVIMVCLRLLPAEEEKGGEGISLCLRKRGGENAVVAAGAVRAWDWGVQHNK